MRRRAFFYPSRVKRSAGPDAYSVQMLATYAIIAAVCFIGVVFLIVYSTKTFIQSGRKLKELENDPNAGPFLHAFWKAHPEAKPLTGMEIACGLIGGAVIVAGFIFYHVLGG
jgi:hypothetical protein